MPIGIYKRTEEEKYRLQNLKKGESKKIKTLCKKCGKEIYVWPYAFKVNGNFCSKKCSNIFHGEDVSERMKRINKGKRLSIITEFKKGHIPWNKSLKLGNNKPKCKICGKEIGYRSTYCLKHKHILWTNEKWEKAWNGSRKKVGIIPKNMQRPGKWKNVVRGYFDINDKQMFFRSKWEANYALYLDFLIKQKQINSWFYEKKVFIFEKIKFGTRSYRPDFAIINNDMTTEYHEVKGFFDNRSKTKIKRMAKYYPNIRLIIIDKDVYGDIKKKLGKMLKFY